MLSFRQALCFAVALVPLAPLLGCTASVQMGSEAQHPPPPPPPPPPPAPTTPSAGTPAATQPASTDGAATDAAGSQQPQASEPAKQPQVTVQRGRLIPTQELVFEPGKAGLQPGASNEQVLQQIKDYLKNNPRLTRLRIEGHTDNVGNPDENLKLSGERALAVKRWLVEHGIAAERIVATGFGDRRPVKNNATEAGRAANRRIEFRIAELDGKPFLNQDPAGGGEIFEL